MTYIKPQYVVSPRAHWQLTDVILDRGEGQGAYALGKWDGKKRIGFRWNGSAEAGEIGNPQSRGLPIWTMLDPALHLAVVELLAPEMQVLTRRFLGLRSATEWQAVSQNVRKLHKDRVAAIAANNTPVLTNGDASLIMHLVPFSAVDGSPPASTEILFSRPERFPPMGSDRPTDFTIDHRGLLTGSNAAGLSKNQRAYVMVSRSGAVESVATNVGGSDGSVDLEKLTNFVVRFSRRYAISLAEVGFSPPMAVLISIIAPNGLRLLQEYIPGALSVDVPQRSLSRQPIHFDDAFFEDIPASLNESARALRPALNHLANASGLASCPFFDAGGNYSSRMSVGL